MTPQALIAQWRAQAHHAHDDVRANTLEECADELEASLGEERKA